MERYLILDEAGNPCYTETITKRDKERCDNDILNIIRLSDGKEYYQNEWIDLPRWINEEEDEVICNF